MAKMNLTENEKKVLLAIMFDNYQSNVGRGCINWACWTWSVTDSCAFPNKRSASGTFSSLVKKGLIGVGGGESDPSIEDTRVVWITTEGFEAILPMYAEAYEKEYKEPYDDSNYISDGKGNWVSAPAAEPESTSSKDECRAAYDAEKVADAAEEANYAQAAADHFAAAAGEPAKKVKFTMNEGGGIDRAPVQTQGEKLNEAVRAGIAPVEKETDWVALEKYNHEQVIRQAEHLIDELKSRMERLTKYTAEYKEFQQGKTWEAASQIIRAMETAVEIRPLGSFGAVTEAYRSLIRIAHQMGKQGLDS